MSRDYVRTPRPKHKASLPGWVWLLGGLFIGLFVALLVYLDNREPGRQQADITGAVTSFFKQKAKDVREVTKQKTQQAPAKPSEQNTRPRFDFYTILPELEVAIPEEDLVNAEKKDKPVTSGKKEAYVLQAGSFRQHEQADRLKAKLALLGIVANIQTVHIKNGETWHRVRVGPIQDIATLNKTRKRLRDVGVPSIVVKNKT